MKTKSEAAHFLGRTERAVERYKAEGKLSARTEKRKGSDGKMREVLLFDEGELQRLKDEINNPTKPARPLVIRESAPGTAEPSGDLLTHLARLLSGQLPPLSLTEGSKRQRRAVPVESKLTLKLDEAAELAGLSANYLRGAIRGGQLKAEKRGRGWNIKRADLDAFVKKL